jgi:hypothetical protein
VRIQQFKFRQEIWQRNGDTERKPNTNLGNEKLNESINNRQDQAERRMSSVNHNTE